MTGSKTVLVTGAGRGLGLCLAQEALAQGHVVFATYRTADRASGLRELEASDQSGRLRVAGMDVADPASVERAHDWVRASAQTLDILFSNAGTNLAPGFDNAANRGPLVALEPAALAFLFEVNVVGTLNVLKSFQPILAATDGSAVVCISSDRASLSLAGEESVSYSVSKAALNMLIRKLRRELEAMATKIVAVHPGWLRTDMGGPTASVDPRDAAREIVALAEGSSYVTGSFVRTNGTVIPW